MNHLQFRKDKKLVAQWEKELRTNKLLQLVMETMEDWHPARHSINGDKNDDISPTRASIELGTTRGYSMYADRLKVLATISAKQSEQPETTYTKEE